MTLLLIPTTLIALIVFTVICVTAKQPVVSAPCIEWITSVTTSKAEPGNVITFSLYESKMDSTPNPPLRSSDMPPPALPFSSHGSTNSFSNPSSARRIKRLSLQVSPQSSDDLHRQRSPTMSTSPRRLSHPPSPDLQKSVSEDSNTFLTALAAQERRVLELKEELEKAEADLTKLKKQWALHETTKKRIEVRHGQQLRHLPSPIKATFETAYEAGRSSREEERRKAMQVRTRKPQRKVFEGGRHTRALSLLSPSSMASRETTMRQRDGTINTIMDESTRSVPNSAPVSRPPTIFAHTRGQQSKGTRDDLMNTGKQLVGDLREGLWTFIEDLRQATVGDEAVTGARSRQLQDSGTPGGLAKGAGRTVQQRTPNRASMPPRRKPTTIESPIKTQEPAPVLIDFGDSFEVSNQMPKNTQRPNTDNQPYPPNESTKGEIPAADPEDDDYGWENWEDSSPATKSPNSSAFSTGTAGSSPRTSMSSDATKDAKRRSIAGLEQIPWPALTKLSPGNLTRTASTLMREWERSLVDPDKRREGRDEVDGEFGGVAEEEGRSD